MGLADKYLPKYTVEDYKVWEGDWELIEGMPYAMAPSPLGKHQKVVFKTGRELANQIELCDKKCNVYLDLDWIVSEDTVIRPDLIVICKEIEEYVKETPEVVVEVVSKSTAQKDEYLKFEIYQKEKVPYYVLVYPDIKKVRAFKLIDGKFDKFFDSDDGVLEIQLKNGCKVSIYVKKLFD
ncbi:Uma2 family endonuclease [Sulfurihydrogenibium sp.]|uniref:Uma2 family endonuclease n=1 Tax=Sulfurihydrogenibium sp. TaxID=2053621 RepID=UPI002625053F|nr:Uma2 family endonuclease [Sulfurihydrogenibium sp.]